MSKTLGNVVTPMDVIKTYGPDALRYYLLRTSSFGQDGDFTWDDFIRRYNGDLANGLGNLVSRTLGMIEQYLGGEIKSGKKRTMDHGLWTMDLTGDIEFHTALAAIWDEITKADKYINENKPWELAK